MPTRADVVAAARGMLDTPWVHQGRLPGHALDCAGLVIAVARQLGIVAPDFEVTGYGRQPDGSMLPLCDDLLEPAPGIEIGAVVVMAVQRDPQHLGIVSDYRGEGFALIHASTTATPPRVIEHRLIFTPAMRLRRIYRFPGVSA